MFDDDEYKDESILEDVDGHRLSPVEQKTPYEWDVSNHEISKIF